MDGCVYRTKDGECDLYAEGGKYHAFCDMDGCDGRRLSHGDKIRAMTDEELAKKMSGLESFAVTCGGAWPPEKWLQWLRQEATP